MGQFTTKTPPPPLFSPPTSTHGEKELKLFGGVLDAVRVLRLPPVRLTTASAAPPAEQPEAGPDFSSDTRGPVAPAVLLLLAPLQPPPDSGRVVELPPAEGAAPHGPTPLLRRLSTLDGRFAMDRRKEGRKEGKK